jgi:N-acetylglucosamine-6-phosphate deacetylase
MSRGEAAATVVQGRLVLGDRVVPGRLTIEGGRIAAVDLEAGTGDPSEGADDPIIAPGFVDLHVHGWGGHDAMGGPAGLDGMARSLLRRGVTSFLPTAVSEPFDTLSTFADDVRGWIPAAPTDGAEPLGFNLEGPFLAESRKGAHDASALRIPAMSTSELAPLRDGLRLITIAPELPGALDLIDSLANDGIVVALGHSAATVEQARAGYASGARSTTHLFNAMSGLDHRAPGLSLVALLDDAVAVELIADGHHVSAALWPLVTRLKPVSRLILVSDGVAIAGTTDRRGRIGSLAIEVAGGRAVVAGTETLAGSVIALDTAVRNLVGAGIPLADAAAAASTNPLDLIGVTDRGRIAPGQRADLVELDAELHVRRVMRGGAWLVGPPG